MSQKPVCNCPPEVHAAKTSPQRGETCPRCQGSRPTTGQLLPAPAKRNLQRASPTEFPSLNLDQPRIQESNAEWESSRCEQSTPSSRNSETQRQKSHQAEQKKIARLLAFAVVLWSLFSLLPGGVAWRSWLGEWAGGNFPMWIPLFAASAAAPICLGIFLWQVPDWCTLKSVAGGLLAVACGYAFAATLFGLASPSSRWLAWLDFPIADAAAATLWCSCMLVLAAILSLVCFLEGQRWQRVEHLFGELRKKSDATGSDAGS